MESHTTGQKVLKSSFWAYCILVGLLLLGLGGYASASELDAARLELERARENLRISKATKERIASELERLVNSGKTSPDVLEDYQTYLTRVQAMVAENVKVVNEMEKVYARRAPTQPPLKHSDPSRTGDMLDPGIPEEEETDEITALDSELNESLATFDEMLLQELESIRLRSAPRMRELAGEAAAAAKRLREKGVGLDTSSPESASGKGKQAGEAEETMGENAEQETQNGASERGQEDQQRGEEGQQRGEEGQEQGKESRGRGYGGGEDPTATTAHGNKAEDGESADAANRKQRDRRLGGQDDDIVARQLRQAAEKETDPELKEKLWKEYEDYKNSNR